MHEVFMVCADTSQNSKDGLNEQWRFDETPLQEMGEVVKVRDANEQSPDFGLHFIRASQSLFPNQWRH